MQRVASDYQPLAASLESPLRSPRRAQSRTKRVAVSVALAIPSLVILAVLLSLCLFGIKISDTHQTYGCDPSGNVWVTNANKPNLWSGRYGLGITLGFGRFPFSAAKLIDILFDLIVGRGGQVLAGILLYYSFRGPVVAAMHRNPVPYDKLMKLEYHSAGTTSFLTYCRDVRWKGRSVHAWYTAFMLALSTFYILLMPTWLSAMSGYQATNAPLLQLDDSTFVAFATVEACIFVIADGERIGRSNFTCVEMDTDLYFGVTEYISEYDLLKFVTPGWTGNGKASAVDKPSTLSPPDQPWHDLSAPVLNITVNQLVDESSKIFYEGHTFSVAELQEKGTCKPEQDYSWGFSLTILFMWLAITWILSILVYIVWVTHYWRSHLLPEGADKIFGDLRTAMTVTESIRNELGDGVASRLSDDGLKKALKERGAGVSLRRLREANSFYDLSDLNTKPHSFYHELRRAASRTSTLSPDPAIGYGPSQSTQSFLR